MSLQQKINTFIQNLDVVESNWKFVTSAGATLSVSTPIAKLGVNGTGGLIQIQRDSDPTPIQLNFGGV
jgi:hypothetical protein